MLLAGGDGAGASVTGALGGDDGDVDALGPVVIRQKADDLLGQVLVARDGGGVGLRRVWSDGEDRQGQAGRHDRTGPAGQEAARRPVGDAGLTCCDGGRERWKGAMLVLMGPG